MAATKSQLVDAYCDRMAGIVDRWSVVVSRRYTQLSLRHALRLLTASVGVGVTECEGLYRTWNRACEVLDGP